MPPATTKEHQLARDRKRAKDYRDRHPERAREARRKADAKRRGHPDWKPKIKIEVPRCKTPDQAKMKVRAAMIRARMEYLSKRIRTPADHANG